MKVIVLEFSLSSVYSNLTSESRLQIYVSRS